MAPSKAPYLILLAILVLFNSFIFLTPYLASEGDPAAPGLYTAFAPTCHQLTSRSLCLFKSNEGAFSIRDCFPTSEFSLSHANVVRYAEGAGYKLPVCARDVAIYGAMLLGLLVLPLIQKIESEDWPSKWLLVAAAIPIAIDGTSQLFGMRESDNLLRIITGFIIGIVLPFYLLPMLNSLCSAAFGKIDELKVKGKEKEGKNTGKKK